MALKSIKYPFGKDSSGFPATTVDETSIKDSLTQLVLTAKGERVMRPDLGTNIRKYIFDNTSEFLAQLINLELKTVIGKYEPRVIVTSIDLQAQDTTMIVGINYVYVSTGSTDRVDVAVPVSV